MLAKGANDPIQTFRCVCSATCTHARTKTVSIAFNGNVTSHVNNQTANHIHRTHKTCIFVTTNDRQPQQEKTTKTETKHTHTQNAEQ